MPRKITKRKAHVKTEYTKTRKAYRSAIGRHVLVIEADMTEDQKRKAFAIADQLRIAGNEATAWLRKRYSQLARTKKHKKLKRLYGKVSDELKDDPTNKELLAEKKRLGNEMQAMQKKYRVTFEALREKMIYLQKRDGLQSVFALTRAEAIWQGMEKILYHGASKLHFSARGRLPIVRAKQMRGAITAKVEDGRIVFSAGGVGRFSYVQPDQWQADELCAVIAFLQNPDEAEAQAASAYAESGVLVDTFRPCYAALKCVRIRGKLRVYIHLTVEGNPLPKLDKDENIRHIFDKRGRVGCDIGTQTEAHTSETEVGLTNLAERGSTIRRQERQERLLQRKMQRSQRATNPQNYNEDGTIKKGQKHWGKSKRYLKLRERHAELSRKNADSRKFAICEQVNHLRHLGDILVTEPSNAKKLQKKAKRGKDKNGKEKHRKRFGKSIQNRCPGAFQSRLKAKFLSTGGEYHEVPSMFRASQYDHTNQQYVKKTLGTRLYHLSDGTQVQRDMYSSLLMFCADDVYMEISQARCEANFPSYLEGQNNRIAEIRKNHLDIKNSGIKAA